MARKADDGRTWGRPEALDTLGRPPGSRRRSLGTLLGVAAIAAGAHLGITGPAGGAPGAPAAAVAAPAGTCASVGITLPRERIPAEGVAQSAVVRLSRADAGAPAELLVPEAYVLTVAPVDDGIRVSVLVRTDPQGGRTIDLVNAASADGSLAAAVLYDVDPRQVLDECRSGR
jgi:hypothetical protein